MSYLGTGSDFGNFITGWLLRLLQQDKMPDKLELGAFQHIWTILTYSLWQLFF